LDRITINPAVLFGKPTIRNMRYPVAMLLDLLSAGMTNDEILEDYPAARGLPHLPHAEACRTHVQQEQRKNRPGFPRKSTKGSPPEQKFLSSKPVEETNSG
jgi:hypothetical protein